MGELVQLEPGTVVDRWKVEKKLGEGAFGAVYKAKDDKNNIFALKVEGKDEKVQLLKMEVYVLAELAKAGGRHFCKIEGKGQQDSYNYVVMTFVGMSLADLRNLAPGKKFRMGTALSVGIQCLEALEDLHSIGYLHRDVKPGNYTIGRAEVRELRKVYVLDFGMARKFIANDGKTLRKPRENAGFRGTVKYAPLACHQGKDQSRYDDIESWLYMTVELTRGNLPWRNITDMNEIGKFKHRCRADKVPQKQLFGGCPTEFVDVLKMIDTSQFFDEPDYDKIYQLCRKAIKKLDVPEFPYDWEDFLNRKMEEEKKPTTPPAGKKDEKKDAAKDEKKKDEKKEEEEEEEKKEE